MTAASEIAATRFTNALMAAVADGLRSRWPLTPAQLDGACRVMREEALAFILPPKATEAVDKWADARATVAGGTLSSAWAVTAVAVECLDRIVKEVLQ